MGYRKKIRDNISKTESVVGLLDDLVRLFDELESGIRSVETLSKQQKVQIEEINEGAQEIDQIIVSNSAFSLQHKESAKELLEQVDKHRNVVSQLYKKFRLN